MGYDLHITRQEDWADTEAFNISIDEWLAYVANDKELELTKGYNLKMDSAAQFQNRQGYCEWNAHPTEQEPNARPWFDYWKGSISTKNPDTPTVRKMIQIASALKARVQGDDGEFYTEQDLVELEKADEQRSTFIQKDKKPWWKFW